jgi:hypothetical protein
MKRTSAFYLCFVRLCDNIQRIWQGENDISDVERYIQKCAERDDEFAENFEEGYIDYKIGGIPRQARELAQLTQEEDPSPRIHR